MIEPAPPRATFRPRARLLSLLGEQLISDQAVGLIELVKNAYDADATEIRVTLANLKNPDATEITIQDNGCGMTLQDVEQKWLSPAVDHKEQQKQRKQRSPRGRLPIGEKGVGRFAVHQLGRQLELVTRAPQEPEVVVRVNWDDFDRGEAYLEDLPVDLVTRSPVNFTDDTGTLLTIRRARVPWTESLVARVQRALRRLQSPHTGHEDFRITLVCPDFPAYERISPGDITERAHYVFRGLVDDQGRLDYEYECHLPGLAERRAADDSYNLLPAARAELSGPTPICGSFYINFYVWDRSRDYLVASGVSREDLDAMAGVALFRDGLRVLPYGEPGNDWLDLDRDRINDPSHRIGNQQIMGFIEVDQSETPYLRDKTNREGLIENAAFHDLRALVRASINAFTIQWLKDRPESALRPRVKRGALQTATAIARAVAPTARDDVLVDLGSIIPHDASASDANGTTSPPPGLSPEAVAPAVTDLADRPSDTVLPYSLVTQRQAVTVLTEHLKQAELFEQQQAQDQQQQAATLLHLAATGMAAERVVHEFGRQVHAGLDALSALRNLVPGNTETVRQLRILDACLGTLRNEFRVLAPYEADWRMQRTAEVSVRDAIDVALDLNRAAIQQGAITVDVAGTDFSVTIRPAALVQVVDNLLYNAVVWLQTDEERLRKVRLYLDAGKATLTVADSGPGIPLAAREHIFDPFFSLRNGGRGLGLYITRELLRSSGASIELVPSPEWTGGRGAAFQLCFPLSHAAPPARSDTQAR